MARAPAVLEIDETPEVDRLDGVPHPRATRDLFGHSGAENLVAEAVAAGRMPHGWLLTGPAGVGKATFAYRLARHLLADPGERDPHCATLAIAPETRAARQVAALSHPGLLVIRRPWDAKAKRFAQSITVDEVRRSRGFLAHSVDEGHWRVVICDSADELNVNAANALLKMLEEPPKRTVFLLVASEPGRLLATIRSRCRVLDFAPLGLDDLRRAVAQAYAGGDAPPPGAQDWERLAVLSEGSVRRALTITASGGLALYERVFGLVSALPRVDWAGVHSLSDELAGGAAEANFLAFHEFLSGLVTRLVRAATTGQSRIPAEAALAETLIGADAAAWAEFWQELQRTLAETLLLNLDRKALVLATIARLEALATRARA